MFRILRSAWPSAFPNPRLLFSGIPVTSLPQATNPLVHRETLTNPTMCFPLGYLRLWFPDLLLTTLCINHSRPIIDYGISLSIIIIRCRHTTVTAMGEPVAGDDPPPHAPSGEQPDLPVEESVMNDAPPQRIPKRRTKTGCLSM